MKETDAPPRKVEWLTTVVYDGTGNGKRTEDTRRKPDSDFLIRKKLHHSGENLRFYDVMRFAAGKLYFPTFPPFERQHRLLKIQMSTHYLLVNIL